MLFQPQTSKIKEGAKQQCVAFIIMPIKDALTIKCNVLYLNQHKHQLSTKVKWKSNDKTRFVSNTIQNSQNDAKY
jgi:hypothetical protein